MILQIIETVSQQNIDYLTNVESKTFVGVVLHRHKYFQ